MGAQPLAEMPAGSPVHNSPEDVGPEGDAAVLARLRDGADFTELGIDLGLNRTLRNASAFQLARSFGGRFAERVFALEDDVWSGPLESVHGVHFVRVTARTPPAPPVFEEIEPGDPMPTQPEGAVS